MIEQCVAFRQRILLHVSNILEMESVVGRNSLVPRLSPASFLVAYVTFEPPSDKLI